jgi:hypothetical protein
MHADREKIVKRFRGRANPEKEDMPMDEYG